MSDTSERPRLEWVERRSELGTLAWVRYEADVTEDVQLRLSCYPTLEDEQWYWQQVIQNSIKSDKLNGISIDDPVSAQLEAERRLAEHATAILAALGHDAPTAAAIRQEALREAAVVVRTHESLHCTSAQFEDADENGIHTKRMDALSKAADEIEALAAQEGGGE